MPSTPLVVWVLAPFLETSDPNLEWYYDYSQGFDEYKRAFSALGIKWKWELVTMANYAATIDRAIAKSVGRTPVIMNLCDGDETNGVPGISVIHLLKERGLCFTGADAPFYHLTTSKIVMKRAFDAAGVPTPLWEEIPAGPFDAPALLDRLGNPLIVKPAVSAGSMGITVKSVVHTADELTREVTQLYDGYRGWDLTDGGVFAESFIAGREFTTFIVGSYDAPTERRVYPSVERVFNESLPATEQFLSFDRLWEIYERETRLVDDEYLWHYAAAPTELQQAICDVSWDAYVAVEGTGYGRVDLRYDAATGRLFVLEVNAQCGISEDENNTSIGAVLRFAGVPYSKLVREILDEAIASAARGTRRNRV